MLKLMRLLTLSLLVLGIPLILSAQVTQRTNQADGNYQTSGTLEHFPSIGGIASPILGDPSGLSGTTGFISIDPSSTAVVFLAQTIDVDEDEAVLTSVQLLFEDPDNDVLAWSINSGNTNNTFSIDQNGILTLEEPLDFEILDQYVLQVQVEETFEDDGVTPAIDPVTLVSSVTINVLDVNEAPNLADAVFDIDEDAINGTLVGNMTATDEDVDPGLTYSLSSGLFSIDENTGDITVIDETLLNFENFSQYIFTVTVIDNGGLIDEATLTIDINDVNDAPTIEPIAIFLAENTGNGPTIESIQGDDEDVSDVLTYSTSSTVFDVDINTGVISVIDQSALDFETTPSFVFTVTVSDGVLTADADVTVNLTDVNETPILADLGLNLDENTPNGTLVTTLNAIDQDNGEVLTYTFDNAETAFSLDLQSGELRVLDATLLDFEQTIQFVIPVTVTDNGDQDGTGNNPLTDGATLTINIGDVNDPPAVDPFVVAIDENTANGTILGNVIATDEDVPAQTLTYTTSSTVFSIDGSSGEVTISNNAALDFEAGNPQTFVVTVTDNGDPITSTEITAVVNLNDVPEPPVLNDQTFSVREVAKNGDVVGTLQASDQDANSVLTYSITSNVFAVNSSTGVITVIDDSQLDFAQTTSYTINMSVADNTDGSPLTDDAVLTINVIRNSAPTISVQSFSIPENALTASTIGNIIASDVDGDPITWTIVSTNFPNIVNLSSITGQLSLVQGAILDHETNPTLTYNVQVSDGDKSNQAVITVNVTDVNEIPVINDVSFSVAENSSTGASVGVVSAVDQEGGELTYSIVSGNTNSLFNINPSTGEITLNGSVNFEGVKSYTLGVLVSDNALTSIKDLVISITDVNESPVLNDIDFSVKENRPNGSIIGTLTGIDPEGGTLTYTISSGNTGNAFAINASNGKLSVANSTALDFETNPRFDLGVNLSDGENTVSQTITIFLEDVAESRPPVALAPGFTVFYVAGDVLTLEGFDPDGDPILYEVINNPATGSLLATSKANEFTFTPNASQIPENLYQDSVTFRVIENTPQALVSQNAVLKFRYEVLDQAHEITELAPSSVTTDGGTFTLSWTDEVFNSAYSVNIKYFDFTNPAVPSERILTAISSNLSDLSATGNILSYVTSYTAADHPYLFSGNNVFITAEVSTNNGNSSFDSYIFNSSAGGRVEASADGQFFAFGSEMSVTENKTVNLRLLAVELGNFNLNNASIEILSNPLVGTVGQPVVAETNERIITWNVNYTSTAQIAGRDSVQFRVFHPDRQIFDTAWARVDIVGVNDLPSIQSIADRQINEDDSIMLPVSFNDPDNEVNIVVESNESTSVPATYTNGMIKLVPKANFFGSVSVNVIVTEVGTAEQFVAYDRFELDVLPVNDPPVVSPIADQSIDEDGSINLVVGATDVDASNPVFDFRATVDRPSDVDISVNGNNILLTPRANVNGTFKLAVTADDRTNAQNSTSAADTFLLSVNPVNDAPEVLKRLSTQNLLTNIPAYNINLGAFFTDVESGSNLTYTVTGNDKVNLSLSGSVLNVSLTQGFTGVEDVTIKASDDSLDVSQTVTFVVSNTSSDVTVKNAIADQSLNEDFGTFSLDISNVFSLANVSDPTFTYTILGNNFVNASFSQDNKQLVLSSTANYFGTETIYLVGTSDNKSAFESFNLQIAPVNDAPLISSVNAQSTREDVELKSIFVGVTDVDTELSKVTATATINNSSLVDASGFRFITTQGGFLMDVTPAANQNGTGTVTVTVSDSLATASTTFELTVTPVNDAPILLASTIADINEDVAYSLDVSTLFSDPEGDVLTYTISQFPEWATVDGNVIAGTPGNDRIGSWSIQVAASDTLGGLTQATFDFNVLNVNDAPILVNPLLDIQAFQDNVWNFSVPATTFSDIDPGDQLNITFESFPAWATVGGNSLTGTPGYQDIGNYTLIIKATDQAGAFVLDTANIQVVFTNYVADVTLQADAVCAGEEVIISASGAIDYNWFDESNNLLQSGGSQLAITPDSTTTYVVRGVDGQGQTTAQLFNITVEVFPLPVATIVRNERSLIVSETSGATYQWYRNNTIIENENSSELDIRRNGEYYVVVTSSNGCETVSDVLSVSDILGLEDIFQQLKLYPNPTSDWITLENKTTEMDVTLYDINGRIRIVPMTKHTDRILLDVRELNAGVYYLKMNYNGVIEQRKFIKLD
jgi:hypothetical protein